MIMKIEKSDFLFLALNEGGEVSIIGLIKADRADFLLLLDYFGVLEMASELGSPLNPCIADMNDLLRIEFLPFMSVKLKIEIPNEFRVQEV